MALWTTPAWMDALRRWAGHADPHDAPEDTDMADRHEDPATTTDLPADDLPPTRVDRGGPWDEGHAPPPQAHAPLPESLARGWRAITDADDPAAEGEGDPCPTCGQVTPPARWFLADTLAQVSTRAPQVFATFYASLFSIRPDLARLFPVDLADPNSDPSGGGYTQREKLLAAVAAVATHYNPSSPASIAALNDALDKMGTTHGESRMSVADPDWPSGHRPLLQREYDIVNEAMVRTLAEFQGDSWTRYHNAAWWTALTYVANRMGAAQILYADTPRHAAR